MKRSACCTRQEMKMRRSVHGVEQQYRIDGEILRSIVSGYGSTLPAVVVRLGIGRAAFNKLYRVFKRKQLTMDTRLRFFETYVASTLKVNCYVQSNSSSSSVFRGKSNLAIGDARCSQHCSHTVCAVILGPRAWQPRGGRAGAARVSLCPVVSPSRYNGCHLARMCQPTLCVNQLG